MSFCQMDYWFLIYRTHSPRYAHNVGYLNFSLLSSVAEPPKCLECVRVNTTLCRSRSGYGLTVAHFRIKTQKLSSFFNMLLHNLLPLPNSLGNSLIKHTHTHLPVSPSLSLPHICAARARATCNCISLVRRFLLRVTCHTAITVTATVTVASTTFAYAPKTMLRIASEDNRQPP